MKKSKIKGIEIPMHLVCNKEKESRNQDCIHFENGFMYATNAYIGIRAEIKEFTGFEDNEIKMLDGKNISYKTFEKLFKCNVLFVKEDGIEDTSEGILYKFKEDIKYPNLDKIFEDTLKIKNINATSIGINYKFVELLGKCINPNLQQLFFDFKDVNQPILVRNEQYSESKLLGLIMQVKPTK